MNTYGRVYRVTNTVNGRVYIGQTKRTIAHRWSVHKSDAANRPKSYFHKAIAKHGAAVFVVEQLGTAESMAELDALESRWIADLRSSDPVVGYNLTAGGEAGMRTEQARANNRLAHAYQVGRPLSAATKAKMSATRKGRPQSESHKLARALATKGRTPSLACRNAVAEANRHRQYSPETRAKLRLAAQRANLVRWGSKG